MSDTQQGAVHREQGGNKMVVATTGEIEFQSGSILDIQAGASVTDAGTKTESGAVSQTGIRTLSAAGRIRFAVTAGSSGGSTIPPAGIGTFTSTGKAETFAMSAAPAAGDVLHLACDVASSTGTCSVLGAVGVTFSSTAALRRLVFNTPNTLATVVAVSATRYAVDESTAYVPTST